MRKPGQKGDKKNRVRKEIRKTGLERKNKKDRYRKKNEKTGSEGNERKPVQKEMRENRFVKNGNEINR